MSGWSLYVVLTLIKRPCYGTTLNLSLQEVCRIQYFRTWSGLSIVHLQCNWLALGKTWNIRKENLSSENIFSAQASKQAFIFVADLLHKNRLCTQNKLSDIICKFRHRYYLWNSWLKNNYKITTSTCRAIREYWTYTHSDIKHIGRVLN